MREQLAQLQHRQHGEVLRAVPDAVGLQDEQLPCRAAFGEETSIDPQSVDLHNAVGFGNDFWRAKYSLFSNVESRTNLK